MCRVHVIVLNPMNVVQFIVDLEKQLIAAKDCGKKLIVTDGVFSMDGFVAPLP